MSFADYQRKMYHYNKRANDEYRSNWEVARFTSFINYKINGGKINSVTGFYRFPWDDGYGGRNVEPMTPGQAKKIHETHMKFFNKQLENAKAKA